MHMLARCYCTHAYTISVHISIHMPAHMSIHMPAYMPAHMSMHMSGHMPARMSAHMPVHVSTHMSAHACKHVCMCVCIYLHTGAAYNADAKLGAARYCCGASNDEGEAIGHTGASVWNVPHLR